MKLQPGNPMQSVLHTVLAFEVIVYGLSIFVLDRIAGLPIALAAALGGESHCWPCWRRRRCVAAPSGTSWGG